MERTGVPFFEFTGGVVQWGSKSRSMSFSEQREAGSREIEAGEAGEARGGVHIPDAPPFDIAL